MNSPHKEEVERVVFDSLEDILMIPQYRIQRTDLLLRDLKLDGDDFSFLFVPNLEKVLQVKTTQEEWDKVYTVQDAIDVFTRAVERKNRG